MRPARTGATSARPPFHRALFPFLRVRTGRSWRRVPAPPRVVHAALMADPGPGELARWRMTEYRRVDPHRATYLSRGRPTEARFERVDPPHALRWVSRGEGKEQTLNWRLEPDGSGGTVLHVDARLSFRVSAGHMTRVLQAALDGVASRVAAQRARDARD